MKTLKRHITLDNFTINGENLIVSFTFDNETYYEDTISEGEFEKYIKNKGSLEYYLDRWDYTTESTYQEYFQKDYSEWLKDECQKEDVMDFLDNYYKENKIPKIIEE